MTATEPTRNSTVGGRSSPVNGPEALAELIGLLDLEPSGRDRFDGQSCSRSLPFVFGGQVAAQALACAYTSVHARLRVHSLHAYFVRAGDPDRPLRFEVERVRDGRSFVLRRVVVAQAGEPVFIAAFSFTRDQPGFEHAERPAVAFDLDPGTLRTRASWLAGHEDHIPEWWSGPMAMDVRFTELPPQVPQGRDPARPRQQLWMRADGTVPDDQRVHDCLVAFATDLTLLDPVVIAHGRSWYLDDLRAASLDHAVWFHRPPRVDDWLLYEQASPVAHGGRGLATGSIFDRTGRLVVSTAQEGLIWLPNRGNPEASRALH